MADRRREPGPTGDRRDKEQDPRVARLRPDPAQPARRSRSLAGLWGDSDRPGRRRLYLTGRLDVYAEFADDDVLHVEDVPADRAPFPGEPATRVELRHDAPVDITRSRRVGDAGDLDEFDLDIRVRAPYGGRPVAEMGHGSHGPDACMTKAEPWVSVAAPCPHTQDHWMCPHTFGPHTCPDTGTGPWPTAVANLCPAAPTVQDATCQTCATQCGTCETQCGTCATQCGGCWTEVGHTWCGTCHTDWGQTQCDGCHQRRRR